MGGRDPWIGRMLGRLSLQSAAHPWRTVVAIVVLTAGVGAGMVHLETDSDLLKILPKDDPHTHAAQNASREFRGFYDFVTFFYAIDPAKCEEATAKRLPHHIPAQWDPDGDGQYEDVTCDAILHEAYVRGMDEIWRFMQAEIPEAEYAIDFANIVKTVNWTNSGTFSDRPDETFLAPLVDGDPDRVGRPRDEAFSMPGTGPDGSMRYWSAFQGAMAADEAATDVVARTFEAGRTIIFFNTTDADVSRVDLGRAVYRAVDAYQAHVEACDEPTPEAPCTLRWNVFDSRGLAVRGVSSTDAHATDTTERDISLLAPIIVWAIIMVLFLAFRQPRVILVAAANLFIAFVWTAGLMGWLEIPFSALNMTIVPLILGVGIDYGIHMVSEYLEHKSEGKSDVDAFARAGRRAGIAMAIATVTTSVGLLLMVWSPSVLMGQLGIVSSLALLVTFLFTMTLIPALLTLTAGRRIGRRHRGSRWIPALAARVGRHRKSAVAVVVALSVAAVVGMQSLHIEGFGNPELNYPKGDRLRDDAEWISDRFFGGSAKTQSNYLIIEGDLTRPEVHDFLDDLTANLAADERLDGFNTASLTRVVRGWLAINQGTPDAVVSQFVLQNAPDDDVRDAEYPQTQEEIREVFDEIFASPFANFMTILLNRDYDMGMVSFDTTQDTTFEESKRIWEAALDVVERTKAESGVEGVHIHLFGNNAFSYLFITKEQPWVNTVGVVSFVLVVAMIAALTRNVRATACTAAVMATTGLWWLGLLPVLGIGVSVGLMLPMVFIMAIGSDDAIHLIWNMQMDRDRRRVYRFVGQAVFLTTVTTVVAFSIFSAQTDLLVRRSLLATAAAVAVMWLATMLIVPVFYPPRPEPRALPRPPRPEAAPSRAQPVPVPVPRPKAGTPPGEGGPGGGGHPSPSSGKSHNPSPAALVRQEP